MRNGYSVTACSDHNDWFFVILPWEADKYIAASITKEWCEKNCNGRWTRRGLEIAEAMYFELESDKVNSS